MSRILNSIRQGITRARGRESTASIEHIPPELIESEILPDPKTFAEVSMSAKEFEERVREVQEAFKNLSFQSNSYYTNNPISISGCVNCTHDKKHHKPDKRMASGLGMCICHDCKKYVEPSMYLGTVDSMLFSHGSWSGPMTSSSSNYYTVEFDPSISVSSGDTLSATYTYKQHSKPTMLATISISQLEWLSHNTTNPIDIVKVKLQSMGVNVSKISILSYRANSGMNGDVRVSVEYIEI